MLYFVTSILGIITAINEHIIDTTPTPTQAQAPIPSTFPFSLCISALKEIETLVEVVAEQFYGDDKKWNFIMFTEALKVMMRLALFRASGYKMLLHGGETPNTVCPDSHNRYGHPVKPGGHQGPDGHNPWTHEGKALAALSRFGENARIHNGAARFSRIHELGVVPESSILVTERPSLTTILSEKGLRGGMFLMGETLFIWRPLIYVLFIRKYGTRSWFPWFVSLAVELIGMGATSQGTKSQQVSDAPEKIHLYVAEKDELRRRKVLWALYVMRDPFFSKYTRQKLESTQKMLEPVPLIGLLTEKLLDLIFGAQSRYTYMSGS